MNDLDNAITEIDYNDPMAFFDIEREGDGEGNQ